MVEAAGASGGLAAVRRTFDRVIEDGSSGGSHI